MPVHQQALKIKNMNNNKNSLKIGKSCFHKIYKGIYAEYENEEEYIFEAEEGFGLKYDLPLNTDGYVNIWIEADDSDENEVNFEVFNVTGKPVIADTVLGKRKRFEEDAREMKGTDFYERYAYNAQPLSKVKLFKDGSFTSEGDVNVAKNVISNIASLY